MMHAARMGEFHGPYWGPFAWHPFRIVLTILAFMVWWPIGLAILAFMIGSGRMACWSRRSGERWQRKFDRMQETAERWCRGERSSASSGNRAFDEYRDETLRRLEEEQREFRDFLDRLRHAKDKAEFDQFMNERRNRPPEPPVPHAGNGSPAPQA